MPRSIGTVIHNNFTRGLITEATGLNFPENAATDTLNVLHEKVGSIRRRLGIDVEGGAEAKGFNKEDGVVREFIWQSVGGMGGFTFLVLQIGYQIYFFELTVNDALSGNAQPANLDLRETSIPGSSLHNMIPASFAAGQGYLFVAHPGSDVILVRYNKDLNVFEKARVVPFVRDFEGVDDGLGVTEEPAELSIYHYYNLQNQGWNKYVRIGTRSNEIGETGSGGWLAPHNFYPIVWYPMV